MWRRAPSLEATEAFLAAARADSFQEAAAQLAISPSAFSRRIQVFENFVGIALFDRSGPSPRLLEIGARLRDRIEPALNTVCVAIAEARHSPAQSVLRVVASHSLALGWLMPRLADLHATHGIRIDLAIGRGAHHLRSGAVDLALWGGVEDAGAYPHDVVAELDAVPAASTRLLNGQLPPQRLEDLGVHSLLYGKSAPNPWLPWLAGACYRGALPKFVEMANVHLACESAANGFGIVLASPLLADHQVRQDRLVPCFPQRHRVPIHYKLIYADPAACRREEVKRFRSWLMKQIQESLQVFDRWVQASHASATA